MKDFCTGLPSDWWLTKTINHCCRAHDEQYVAQEIPKYQSDWEFYLCVEQATNMPLALVIGLLASIGGVLFWYRRKWRG